MTEKQPEYVVSKTPEGQIAAETPDTRAPAGRSHFWGEYGYWLGDTERRYGRMRQARNIPASVKLEMLRDPIIAMALGFISSTLIKAHRVIECTDERKRLFFDAMFRAWEREFMLQAAIAVAFGSIGLIKRLRFAVPEPVEIDAPPVWTSAATPLIVTGFDMCYPVTSSPRFDNKRRHFQGMNVVDGRVDVYYSLWLTVGQARAFGAYEGSGRLENAYKHWWIKHFGWDLFLVHLQKNINPVVMVEHPAGTDKDSGKKHSALALATGDAVRGGATVAVPSSVYETVDQMTGDTRLAAVKKWAVSFLEGGKSVHEFHEVEDQCDRKISLGMFLPYQAIFEVTGGDLGGPTSADKLTDLAEQVLLMEAADVDRHLNDYVFPQVSKANFPPSSPLVRVRTTGLAQDTRAQLMEIIKVVMGKMSTDTNVFNLLEALRTLDMPVNEPLAQTNEGASSVGLQADDESDEPLTPEQMAEMAREQLSRPPDAIDIPDEDEIRQTVRRLRDVFPEVFD